MNTDNVMNAMKSQVLKKFMDAEVLYRNGHNKPLRFGKTLFKKSDLTNEDLLELLEYHGFFFLSAVGNNLDSLSNDFSDPIFDEFLMKLDYSSMINDVEVSETVFNFYIEQVKAATEVRVKKGYGNRSFITWVHETNLKHIPVETFMEEAALFTDYDKKKISKGLKLYYKNLKDEDKEALKLLFMLT